MFILNALDGTGKCMMLVNLKTLLITNVVYGNGNRIEMSLRMLLNACLDLPGRFHHINSSRYPDSSSSRQPLIRFSLIFTLFQ